MVIMAHFFERQDEARQNTTQLIVIYSAAVLGLILGLYATVLLVLVGKDTALIDLWNGIGAMERSEPIKLFRPLILLAVTAATLAFIGGARVLLLRRLRKGGRVVARRLYGTKIDPAQAMGGNRQLVNVVEEMAVAAGVPVPTVYVLEEEGINAFSAGLTPEDAVIGVTRSAVDRLDRDELQGLVAHEFSHILNGDMTLNLRLMGWTHGIQLLSDMGRGILRMLFYLITAPFRYVGHLHRSFSEASLLQMVIIAIAFLIFTSAFVMPLVLTTALSVGVLGLLVTTPTGGIVLILATALAVLPGFCALAARLLKARVSREREVLADAAAVQFTRNPKGIGGALLTLRDCEHGGAVQARYAGTVRHLFFASVSETTGLLSTHPPTDERLRQIDPSLLEHSSSGGDGVTGDSDAAASTDEASAPALSPEDLVERAGTLSPEMLAQARALHDAIPDELLDTVHQPLGAVAVCYALMLDEDPDVRTRQMDVLWKRETPPVFEETERLADRVASLDRSLHLPLVEVAAPSLRDLSTEQRERLRETIRAVAEADDRITIFEFALETAVRHALDPDFSTGRANGTGLAEVQDDVVALLSGLAQAGHEDENAVQSAFASGYEALADAHDLPAATPTAVGPEALHTALDRLAGTPDALREEILQACARCATADDTIARTEEDLLRAVAVAVGVPLPPGVSEAVVPD